MFAKFTYDHNTTALFPLLEISHSPEDKLNSFIFDRITEVNGWN